MHIDIKDSPDTMHSTKLLGILIFGIIQFMPLLIKYGKDRLTS
jgi:hypothetical protein